MQAEIADAAGDRAVDDRSHMPTARRGYQMTMLIAGIIAVCIVLLVLAFLLPRLSRHPQRGVDRALAGGQQGAGMAPGKLGRWLQKPFQSSRKATNKSAAAGRQGRGRLPL